MKNKVILTADDYGVCDRIDQGILEAVKKGRLTSVSVIVTFPGWRKRMQALKDLKAAGHEFGIGLHFCITAGSPISENINSPLRHPEHQNKFRVIQNYNFEASETKDVAEELEAQFIEFMKEVPENEIDHLTNHHNIVYADVKFYEAFIRGAHKYKVPIRTPMSWYRKFKKFQAVPDYEGGDMLNPTMRRGIKIGMWRKLGQMSYGNLLKRMRDAENLSIRYPDVLCEYIYGQCNPDEADGAPGKQVIRHALYQFIERGQREELNKKLSGKDVIPVDDTGIYYANEHTVKKAAKFKKKHEMDEVVRRYSEKRYSKEFSMELIFHLAIDATEPTSEERELHGINADYFTSRNGELKALLSFELDRLKELMDLNLIPFKRL